MHEEIPRHVEEVEQVPQVSEGEQVPIVGGGNDGPVVAPKLNNSDTREDLLSLARVVTTRVNLILVPRVNVVESNMTSLLRDFVRMNPPIFLVSNVEEDRQKFLDGVYKVFSAI